MSSAFRRVHLELLAQVATDYALEQVDRVIDFEQDDDSLTLFRGPDRVALAAGATATELDLPIGAAAVKFLAVSDVTGASGINVRLGAVDADPILVKPPTGTDKVGVLVLSTSAASVYVDNPSADAEVRATIVMGCSE